MATYLYETIPSRKGERVEQFEIRQSMKDDALTRHPRNGKPIRRVVTGGFGFISSGTSSAPAMPSSGHSCGTGGCGCAH